MSVQLDATQERGKRAGDWSKSRWSFLLSALTLATLLIHGYHPLAEDGGLYVAGVEYTLDPGLFPHLTQFVSEHLRFSIFAPLMAFTVRLTLLPLSVVLLVVYLLSIALTLAGCRALLRRAGAGPRAQLAGTALLAALWTLPIAGTSLMLMDPYVTARSLSTPLSLWGLVFALDAWPNAADGTGASSRRALLSVAGCVLALLLAPAFHPLMAGYAIGLVIVVRLLREPRRPIALVALGLLTILLAGLLQARAPAESGAVVAASYTRYYWFLSQWHWYEIFGLAGPLLVLAALLRWDRGLREPGRLTCVATIVYGCFGTLLTGMFAHESYRAHLVARMQPLRVFLLIYLIMLLFLGAAIERALALMATRSRALRPAATAVLTLLLAGAGFGMFVVQRGEFPASIHIELPGRSNPNPWVQAFTWARNNTPADALFAMEARYITTHGEDAQTFRAIARRSVLPDYSKDGGEAAITPALAGTWAAGVRLQTGLNGMSAEALRNRLLPFGVTWVVLRSNAPAALDCPYRNPLLKVCRLAPGTPNREP